MTLAPRYALLLVISVLVHQAISRPVRSKRHLVQAPARRLRLVRSRSMPALFLELRVAGPTPPSPVPRSDTGLWGRHQFAEDLELGHEGGGLLGRSSLLQVAELEPAPEEDFDLLPLLGQFSA